MGNKNGKTRILDFCLLLLAICSAVGIAQRFGALRAEATEPTADFSVEVLWEAVDAETADCVAVGEGLRFENGTVFGTVKKITRTAHEEIFYREGKELRATFPEGTKEDLYLTVSVTGRKSDQILLREDGTPVLVGQNLRLYSTRATLALTVLSS